MQSRPPDYQRKPRAENSARTENKPLPTSTRRQPAQPKSSEMNAPVPNSTVAPLAAVEAESPKPLRI